MKNQPKTATATQGVDVEKLIANAEANPTTSSVIKDALDTFKAQQAEEQKKAILGQLGEIQGTTRAAVENLREKRAAEKRAKNYLQAVADAEQEFMKTANYKEYTASIIRAGAIYAFPE